MSSMVAWLVWVRQGQTECWHHFLFPASSSSGSADERQGERERGNRLVVWRGRIVPATWVLPEWTKFKQTADSVRMRPGTASVLTRHLRRVLLLRRPGVHVFEAFAAVASLARLERRAQEAHVIPHRHPLMMRGRSRDPLMMRGRSPG